MILFHVSFCQLSLDNMHQHKPPFTLHCYNVRERFVQSLQHLYNVSSIECFKYVSSVSQTSVSDPALLRTLSVGSTFHMEWKSPVHGTALLLGRCESAALCLFTFLKSAVKDEMRGKMTASYFVWCKPSVLQSMRFETAEVNIITLM